MFYIIEKSEQLAQLGPFEDCFVGFIPLNHNYHPALTTISLVYVRPLTGKKGYMLCVDHNESLSLSWNEVEAWLLNNTQKLWLLDKKEALHWFPHNDNPFIVNNDTCEMMITPVYDYSAVMSPLQVIGFNLGFFAL